MMMIEKVQTDLKKEMERMRLEFIEASDLPDAWFQCVYRLLETGREYKIDQGEFPGPETA